MRNAAVLIDESNGMTVCPLSRKEISFLDENLEHGFPEGQESVITEDDIAQLIVCGAGDKLVDKLKLALGDEVELLVSWSRA